MRESTGSRALVWMVLVVAAAACFWVAGNTTSIRTIKSDLRDVNEQLNTVTDRLAQVTSSIENMVTKADLDKELAMVRDEMASLEDELEPVVEPEDELADESVMDMNELFAEMMKTGGAEGDEGGGFGGAFSKMFEGESGQAMAEFSARMVTDMQYSDFFEEVALDPDVEQQVRDIILAHMTDRMSKAYEMMGDMGKEGFDPTAIEEMGEADTEVLRAEVAEVLTPSQLSVWDEYQDTMEERMLAKSFEMQLGVFAPGLTPESRQIALDIMVDETLLAKEAREQSADASGGMQAEIDQQRQVMANARDRLVEYLDEAQLAHFDRFIEQQENQLKLAEQMFGAMTQEQKEESAE